MQVRKFDEQFKFSFILLTTIGTLCDTARFLTAIEDSPVTIILISELVDEVDKGNLNEVKAIAK
jgi:hypothetical protein